MQTQNSRIRLNSISMTPSRVAEPHKKQNLIESSTCHEAFRKDQHCYSCSRRTSKHNIPHGSNGRPLALAHSYYSSNFGKFCYKFNENDMNVFENSITKYDIGNGSPIAKTRAALLVAHKYLVSAWINEKKCDLGSKSYKKQTVDLESYRNATRRIRNFIQKNILNGALEMLNPRSNIATSGNTSPNRAKYSKTVNEDKEYKAMLETKSITLQKSMPKPHENHQISPKTISNSPCRRSRAKRVKEFQASQTAKKASVQNLSIITSTLPKHTSSSDIVWNTNSNNIDTTTSKQSPQKVRRSRNDRDIPNIHLKSPHSLHDTIPKQKLYPMWAVHAKSSVTLNDQNAEFDCPSRYQRMQDQYNNNIMMDYCQGSSGLTDNRDSLNDNINARDHCSPEPGKNDKHHYMFEQNSKFITRKGIPPRIPKILVPEKDISSSSSGDMSKCSNLLSRLTEIHKQKDHQKLTRDNNNNDTLYESVLLQNLSDLPLLLDLSEITYKNTSQSNAIEDLITSTLTHNSQIYGHLINSLNFSQALSLKNEEMTDYGDISKSSLVNDIPTENPIPNRINMKLETSQSPSLYFHRLKGFEIKQGSSIYDNDTNQYSILPNFDSYHTVNTSKNLVDSLEIIIQIENEASRRIQRLFKSAFHQGKLTKYRLRNLLKPQNYVSIHC